MVNSIIFCNFAMYKRSGFGHEDNPNYSPFKTSKVMNKTVKTILQAISYIITLILGAVGGAAM